MFGIIKIQTILFTCSKELIYRIKKGIVLGIF